MTTRGSRGPNEEIALPAATWGLLTEHVMRQIDRRITAARERLGKT